MENLQGEFEEEEEEQQLNQSPSDPKIGSAQNSRSGSTSQRPLPTCDSSKTGRPASSLGSVSTFHPTSAQLTHTFKCLPVNSKNTLVSNAFSRVQNKTITPCGEKTQDALGGYGDQFSTSYRLGEGAQQGHMGASTQIGHSLYATQPKQMRTFTPSAAFASSSTSSANSTTSYEKKGYQGLPSSDVSPVSTQTPEMAKLQECVVAEEDSGEGDIDEDAVWKEKLNPYPEFTEVTHHFDV